MPIAPLVAAAGIGGISDAAQGIFSVYGQRKAQEHDEALAQQQANWNKDQWEAQNKWNLEHWHRINEYNSPVEQMARLAEAGLNPHLMYGKGNVGQATSVGTAGEVKGYDRASSRNILEGIRGFDSMYRFANLKAQTDNLQAQTNVQNQEAYNRSIDGLMKALNLDIKTANKSAIVRGAEYNAQIAEHNARKSNVQATIAENTQPYAESQIKKNLEKTKKEITGLSRENAIKKLQKDVWKLKSDLAKKGLRDADSIIWRVLDQLGVLDYVFELNPLKR